MATVRVRLSAGDDAEENDRLTRQFREELLQLDVDSVTVASEGVAPPGAKGDPLTIGALVVVLANSKVLIELCRLGSAWVTRHKDRRLTIKDGDRTLEINGTTAKQNEIAIREFLNKTDKSDNAE